jgi:hypothetical protein
MSFDRQPTQLESELLAPISERDHIRAKRMLAQAPRGAHAAPRKRRPATPRTKTSNPVQSE